jgi:two-component sensor histidine kinase
MSMAGEAHEQGPDEPLQRAGAEIRAIHEKLDIARVALDRAAAQRRDDRERETLLRNELLHRVRNVLAIVRSIFARTVENGGSLEEVANHFHGRLDALARYQVARALFPGGGFDLEDMVREELQGFQFGADPRISIEGPPLCLSFDAAELVGLAIHELATNSIKFGALSGDEGKAALVVRWTQEPDWIGFEWLESGVPIPASIDGHIGFGREYIEEALPYQLNAETSFALRFGGLHCTIRIPRGAATAAGAGRSGEAG